MLTCTAYTEAGGVGKTTLAANLGVAEARAGRDVLVIDLDQQEGGLSYLFGVGDDRDDDTADSLTRHLVERPRGDFEDLIKTSEGVDIVPAHNTLERLGQFLRRRQADAEDFGERWNPNVQLLRVLREAGVHEQYDTLIIDPGATADHKLYNAIHATRNLVVPFEPSGKGQQSIEGLSQLVDGLEDNLDINCGVLAVVPNKFKGTNDQEEAIAEVTDYDTPVTLRERASLLEGCWKQQCSAFRYVEEHRDRERDYERETLEKFDDLAEYLRGTVETEREATA
jgi:cellulose biosynthesis protein BcsQ